MDDPLLLLCNRGAIAPKYNCARDRLYYTKVKATKKLNIIDLWWKLTVLSCHDRLSSELHCFPDAVLMVKDVLKQRLANILENTHNILKILVVILVYYIYTQPLFQILQILKILKCLKDLTCAILLKSIQDIKYDIPVYKMWNKQIRKYTNTKC